MDLLNVLMTDNDAAVVLQALALLSDQTARDLGAAMTQTDQVAEHRVAMLVDRLNTAKDLRDYIAETVGITA